MYDLNDFLLNSMCITRDNYKLAGANDEIINLLQDNERVYISDELIYGGIDAPMAGELFFLKDKDKHMDEAWWQDKISYIFSATLVPHKDSLEPIFINVRSINDNNANHKLKFNLMGIKNYLHNHKGKKKDLVMEAFLANMMVEENDELVPFNHEYINRIVNGGLISINNYASFILSVSLPVIAIVGRLDEKLTEQFRTFLEGFLNMFLETPFKC